MMAIDTIGIGPLGLNLTNTNVPPMIVTMIGSIVVGPSLTVVPPMAGTLMIGSGAAITAPLGNMEKIPGNTTRQ